LSGDYVLGKFIDEEHDMLCMMYRT